MIGLQIIGVVAAAITLGGFASQLIRAYKIKSAGDVSYFLMIFVSIGMFMWIIYGAIMHDLIVAGANVIGVGLNVGLIFLKNRYGRLANKPA